MPETIALSIVAESLLRRRLDGERVAVTDETRPAYRELADAGLMIPLHTLIGGDESAYRLTEAGVTFRATRPSSALASPSPAR